MVLAKIPHIGSKLESLGVGCASKEEISQNERLFVRGERTLKINPH